MEYETVHLNETKIAGLTARTNNFAPDMGAVIGGLWQRFFNEGVYSSLPDKISGKTLGVYTDYDSDENGDYTFMTACAVSGDIPAGIEERTIPAGKYAKFIVRGSMQTAVGEFWQKLWQIKLDRAYICDFEEYQNSDPDNCEVHIYIGLR